MKKSIKGTRESHPLNLRLYVGSMSPASLRVLNHLKKICDKYLAREYDLEVVDLSVHPELAKRDQIVALPTLIRTKPPLGRKIVGDFSDANRVLMSLDLPRATN